MSLARKVVRGAALSIATSIGSRAIGLIGTLLLTRFLQPAEYGEAGVAFVLVVSANQLLLFGFGQYIVAKHEAGRQAAFAATVYTLATGVIAMGAILLLRNTLGPHFEAPHLGRFVPGLALAMLLDRVGYIPQRVLLRDLDFKTVSVSRTAGELAYSMGSVALAAAGFGAMAIVYGNIARSAVRTLIVVIKTPRTEWLAPRPLSWPTTRSLLAFGVPISIGINCALASRAWDNLLVSHYFGPAIVAFYNLAYNLADIPAVQVGEQIGDVLLPSFAHLPPAEHGDALLRSTMLLALILFPLAIGLGAIAPTVVAAFFDPRWAMVAPMLLWLSALSVTRPLGWTLGSFLQVRDRPRTLMALEGLKLVTLMGGIATFGRLGPLWTCAAVGVAFGLHALASLGAARRLEGLPFWPFLGKLLPPLAACVPMVAAILLCRAGCDRLGSLAPRYRLMLELLTGALAYIGAALLLAREASSQLLRLARGALKKVEAAAPGPTDAVG